MDQPKKSKYVQPTFKNLRMAVNAANTVDGVITETKPTKRDSAEYRAGFNVGLRNKMTGKSARIFDENENQKMGRWEGQNHTFKNKDAQIISKKVGK